MGCFPDYLLQKLKSLMKKATTIFFLLSAQALLATAADMNWGNSGQGNWAEESNWDSGVPTTDNAVIIDNGGTAVIMDGEKGIGGSITIGKGNEGHVRKS